MGSSATDPVVLSGQPSEHCGVCLVTPVEERAIRTGGLIRMESGSTLGEMRPAVTSAGPGSDWVEQTLLSGRSAEVCLRLPEPVDRGTLRRLVAARQAALVG